MSAPAVQENIDWILNPLLQLAGIAITAVGTWAIGRLTQWLGLKNAQQVTATFDDALRKSVTFGLQQVQGEIREKGWDHFDVRDKALQAAFPYMKLHFADAIDAAVAKNNGNVDDAVRSALDRAFPAAVAVAAASPATPPATAPNPPENKDLPPETKDATAGA